MQLADLDRQQEAEAMLVIRREQMEAMDRAMMERFVDKSISSESTSPTGAAASLMKP